MARRSVLAVALALLLAGPALADMYPDASNAKLPEAARNLGMVENVRNWGAIGDGNSHPLSTRYGTLAEAQTIRPSATILAQEIDWCAMQGAIDYFQTLPVDATVNGSPGGTIVIPAGTTLKMGNSPITANRISLTIRGDDRTTSSVKVAAPYWLQFGLDNHMSFASAAVATGGAGYTIGNVLTIQGGTSLSTVTPGTLTVTNAVGGVIQPGGVSVMSGGSYGTPPENPVSVTGGSGTGATFDIGLVRPFGGTLTLDNLHLIADAPGVWALKGQWNFPSASTWISRILMDTAGTGYWLGGFDMLSVTNSTFSEVDTRNLQDSAVLNAGTQDALFVVRQHNALMGLFGHNWNRINAFWFYGGAIRYTLTSPAFVGYQGLQFRRIECAVGYHCLRFENVPGGGAYANVFIDNLYSSQTVRAIEMETGAGVIITNSGWGLGTTRITSLPGTSTGLYLNNVNQVITKGNACGAALAEIPDYTCIHLAGTSGIGLHAGNMLTNPIAHPALRGYVFDSGTAQQQQHDDFFGANVTPVVNSGINNTTWTNPLAPGCLTKSLAAAESYTIPTGINCIYFSNTLVASATVTMPAAAINNQTMTMTWFGGVTALTVSPNAGQALGGAPTAATSQTPFRWQLLAGRWQRI